MLLFNSVGNLMMWTIVITIVNIALLLPCTQSAPNQGLPGLDGLFQAVFSIFDPQPKSSPVLTGATVKVQVLTPTPVTAVVPVLTSGGADPLLGAVNEVLDLVPFGKSIKDFIKIGLRFDWLKIGIKFVKHSVNTAQGLKLPTTVSSFMHEQLRGLAPIVGMIVSSWVIMFYLMIHAQINMALDALQFVPGVGTIATVLKIVFDMLELAVKTVATGGKSLIEVGDQVLRSIAKPACQMAGGIIKSVGGAIIPEFRKILASTVKDKGLQKVGTEVLDFLAKDLGGFIVEFADQVLVQGKDVLQQLTQTIIYS